MIRFNPTNAAAFVPAHAVTQLLPQLELAHRQLLEGSGPGADFRGWIDLPARPDTEELARIREAADFIRREADVLVVVGIGGSYLGARAVIEALQNPFAASMSVAERGGPQIVFAGHQLSGSYHADLLDWLEGKRVCVNVISKSGTTTEPAIAFRILQRYMESRYEPEEVKQRIFVTTDANRGALLDLARARGYARFVVPDDVGGRYSVLTAVGLLPIAVNHDIDALLAGAAAAREAWLNVDDPLTAPPYAYALWRNALLRAGYDTEFLVHYDHQLRWFVEWWKQLYGESEGKDGRGLLPAGVEFTSDLHSMGQFIQDGRRGLIETVLRVATPQRSLTVPFDEADGDGLNYLAGRDLADINARALEGTTLAHVDGGVPNLEVELETVDETTLGWLIWFFEFACGLSGYLNAINPFDQPGVEAYKRNMFALLGKSGYEELAAGLRERLGR
ncbi:MAG: glucose-6-phosphate isomerase [Bacillota bacterium]|nr:glucose-6-phosphate isomerase [Bacillota bacterium]